MRATCCEVPTNLQQDIGSEGVVAMAISKLRKLRKTGRFCAAHQRPDPWKGRVTWSL